MANVVTDTDAGRKRRLPVWMLGASVVDKLSDSGNKDEERLTSEEHAKPQAAVSTIQPITRKPDRRTRNLSTRDDGPSKSIISYHEGGPPKKRLRKGGGEIIHKQGSLKKKIQNGAANSEVESISQGSSGDEINLTVEDLVNIAEEYVNADREKQHGSSDIIDPNSKTRPSTLLISSKVNVGGPIDATRCSEALSRWTNTACSSHQSGIGRIDTIESNSETHPSCLPVSSKGNLRGPINATGCSQSLTRCSSHLSETETKVTESPISAKSATHSMTGDTTQDMLDLFLGSLLKKPPRGKQDDRIIEREGMSEVHESNEQVRSRAEWNEEATLTKKKSSLKAKVAMFLD